MRKRRNCDPDRRDDSLVVFWLLLALLIAFPFLDLLGHAL